MGVVVMGGRPIDAALDVLLGLRARGEIDWSALLSGGEVELTPRGVRFRSSGTEPPVWAWRPAGAPEAVAELAEAELVPESWVDPALRPLWRCSKCQGAARVIAPWPSHPLDRDRRVWPCLSCAFEGRRGATAAPAELVELAAVAGLGLPAIAMAESLARELDRGARVTWAAEPRSKLAGLAEHTSTRRDLPDDPTFVFSLAEHFDLFGLDSDEPRWRPVGGAEAAWPALRDLRRLGVFVASHDIDRTLRRLVLAVPPPAPP